MMNNLFTKLRDFVGLNDPADYDYEYDEVDGEDYQNVYRADAQSDPLPPVPVPVPQEETRISRRVRERNLSTESSVVSMNNVIGMPGAMNGTSEVIVMEPRSFEEMPQVLQSLRERKSVVLNLTIMDPDQAQRAVDFVAGGTYAMDGHQERIGESIFLFTPNCVQVSMPSDLDHAGPTLADPMPTMPRQDAPTPVWPTDQVARMA